MEKKHEENEEIAAMEAAVVEGRSTSGNRAPAALGEGNFKRRKLESGGKCTGFQISLSSTQLNSRGIMIGNSGFERDADSGSKVDNSSRSSYELGISSSSCCSSNRSSEISNERFEFEGLEENCNSEETETSPSRCCDDDKRQTNSFCNLLEESHDLMDSAAKSSDVGVNSTSKQLDSVETPVSTPEKNERMPSDEELEDFFSAAEKQLREKITKKYNFDFEKEKPLEGNYEWVKSAP